MLVDCKREEKAHDVPSDDDDEGTGTSAARLGSKSLFYELISFVCLANRAILLPVAEPECSALLSVSVRGACVPVLVLRPHHPLRVHLNIFSRDVVSCMKYAQHHHCFCVHHSDMTVNLPRWRLGLKRFACLLQPGIVMHSALWLAHGRRSGFLLSFYGPAENGD